MDKTNIEEDIKIIKKYEILELGISSELSDENEITLERYNKAIENTLADREINKVKANKYDALVEKIKENLRNKQLIKETETISDREHLNGEIFALQELIPEEE